MEAKIKLGKACDAEGVAPVVAVSSYSHRSSFSKPSWLLLAIAEMDERIKRLAINIPDSKNSDSFAERAEAYYQQRPELLSLLQDLYNAYISLADRHCQSLAKNHHRRRFSSPISPLCFQEYDHFDREDTPDVNDSDAESSLSYHPPARLPSQPVSYSDMIIAELVIKNVDYDIIVHELTVAESRCNESARKIELQKSLLEVLESERLILLSDNAMMHYRFNALVEENKELASESSFMKRKAAELARCVLRMREDQRVCILSRKIEDLQGQIYALERRNMEYYEQLVKRGAGKARKAKMAKNGGGGEVEMEMENCFGVWKRKNGQAANGGGKGGFKLWNRVKNFDIFLCGPHVNSC